MLILDGSTGEGGGQILRTALGLSLCTGTPFRIENIRGKRDKPGLLRQHLTAVQAATAVGAAEVAGDELRSMELEFRPRALRGGTFALSVGTAGSTTLVLQTVLPALLRAPEPATVRIEGGTHNPFAPPFDFLRDTFAPQIGIMGERMGAGIELDLVRPGFYPAGGGEIEARVTPGELQPLVLLERGPLVKREAIALSSGLDPAIGERELKVVRKKLGWSEDECRCVEVRGSAGPGNVLLLRAVFEHVTETFVGFGERRRSAEAVAQMAVQPARRYLADDVPVGRHLADQLLVPLALAGGGEFRTLSPTRHTRTNAEVIERFLDVRVLLEESAADCVVRLES